MTFKSLMSTVLMGALTIGSLAPTAAVAGEYRHHDRGGNRAYVYQNNGYAYRDHRDYSHHHRHKNRGLAVGAIAAILGLAIVAGAANSRDRDYDDEYDYRR